MDYLRQLLADRDSGWIYRGALYLLERVARSLCHATLDEHSQEADRGIDFNVFSEKKRIEKLRHIHRNPVTRGLVKRPEHWIWSSFRQYSIGESGVVKLTLPWKHHESQGKILTTPP